MDVGEMHYEFKLKLNKVDSLDYNNFLVPEIDWYLNEAQSIYIKTRYSGNNSRAAGYEASQKRTDDLRNLVVRDKIFAAIPTSSDPSVYEILLSTQVVQNGFSKFQHETIVPGSGSQLFDQSLFVSL